MSNDLHRNIKVSKCTVIYLNLYTILWSKHKPYELDQINSISREHSRTSTSAMNYGCCCLFVIAFCAFCQQISFVELHVLWNPYRENFTSQQHFDRKGFLESVDIVGSIEATHRRHFWGTLVLSLSSSHRDNSANLELQKHAGSLVLSLVLFYLVVR